MGWMVPGAHAPGRSSSDEGIATVLPIEIASQQIVIGVGDAAGAEGLVGGIPGGGPAVGLPGGDIIFRSGVAVGAAAGAGITGVCAGSRVPGGAGAGVRGRAV